VNTFNFINTFFFNGLEAIDLCHFLWKLRQKETFGRWDEGSLETKHVLFMDFEKLKTTILFRL